MTRKLLKLFLFVVSVISINCAPSVTFIKPFGIAHCRVEEQISIDLDEYITGSNVTHQLIDPPAFASMRPKIFNFATFQIHSSSSKIIANYIPQDHLGYPNSSEPFLLLTNDLKIYLGSFNSAPSKSISFLYLTRAITLTLV